MATTIKRGENILIRLNIFQNDGTTPQLLTDCSLIKLELLQNNKVIKSWSKVTTVYDDNLRQGTSTSQIEAELLTTESEDFPLGDIDLRKTVEATDAEFETELIQHDEDIDVGFLTVEE